MAPSPVAAVSQASPCGPAREHRVGKPGQQFDEGARAQRGDGEQDIIGPIPG